MSGLAPRPIATMVEFLARAFPLELESAEYYHALLAESMVAHNNRPATALFKELALSAEAYAVSL